MRLLVDEMYPPAIAEQLRRGGADAVAVSERADLRALADLDLFAIAQAQQRALVTENIDDFSLIADDCDRRGEAHHGLLLVSPRKYPRGDRRTIGRIVTALRRLIDQQPSTAATSLRYWL